MEKTAIILVNLGTPEKPDLNSVKKFLFQFLSDHRVVELPSFLWKILLKTLIIPLRAPKTLKNYQKIWWKEGSPLRVISEQQVALLQKEIDHSHPSQYEVHLAMCYGPPSIPDIANHLLEKHIYSWVVLPLYPQYSATTTAALLDQFWELLKKYRNIPTLRYIKEYASHPLYIEALCTHIREHWIQHKRAEQLIFSFHGLPEKNVTLGDPYPEACYQTARLCAQSLNLKDKDYHVCFQSRFGYTPWLQPYLDKTLEVLPSQGVKSVSVICPGFAADCLETLEEVSILNRKIFLENGGIDYNYIPALNTSKEHIYFLSKLITK